MALELFPSFLEVSVSAGLAVVLLTLLSVLTDRRFSPRWRYWAWLVLSLRMAVPWSPVFSTTVVVSLPELALSGGNAGVQLPSGSGEAVAAADAAQAVSVDLVQLAALVWAFGSLLFLLWHGWNYWMFVRQLYRQSRPVEKQVLLLLEQARREMGVRSPVRVLYSRRIPGPLLAGLLRPAIFLPQSTYSQGELSLIFRHELVHFRRRDLWYKLLLLTVNALHWYNPLAYLMARRANADLELSCDCAVVAGSDSALRLAYSQTILKVVSSAGQPERSPAYFTTHFWGEGGRARLQARFQKILEGPERNGGLLLILSLVLVALSSGLVACSRTEPHSQLTFPAARVETDIPAAAAIYNIEPFQVSIQLPEGWTLRAGEETADPLTCPRTPVDIYDGDRRVGSIGYNTFVLYPDTTEENFYRMVYNELMLPNLVTWDCEYTPVRQTETTCNATCRVQSVLHGEPGRMPEAEPVYSPAVLAYDTQLLVYVAASFEEGSVTDDQLAEIADSIRIFR